MSASKRTTGLGESTLERREFLSVGGATIAGTAIGGGEAVGLIDRTLPDERAQQALAEVEAMTFDVFGTVVDWRTSIIREGQVLSLEKGLDLDWESFADAWRRGYAPAMNRVRTGELPWLKIDQLHRLILDDLLVEYDFPAMSEAEIDDLNRVWHRLIPWPDTVRGLWRLKANFTLATLSNGNVALLTNMAKNAGLPWDAVLSAELSGHYKPDPEVYIKAADLLGLPHEKVMMVAAHRGDLRAAGALGFKTAFVPRPLEYGPGREIDTTPDPAFDVNATDFVDLAAQL
jgi:2-haloacid dehalogenase